MILAAVVICFNPNEEVLYNIGSYAYGVDYLYIWDNTPGGAEILKNLPFGELHHYEHRNMGLPYAFNRIIEICRQKGVTHLMTMDQDSRFDDFEFFRHHIELLDSQGEKFLFCPSLNFSGQTEDVELHDTAQSGCTHPMQLFGEVGLFREDFFIGMVDVEMQLKAKEAGYRILQIASCNLFHQIGSGRTIRFLGRTINVSDYSPLRCYYDSRNRILMWYEFPYDMCTRDKIRHFTGRLKVMVKIALFEKNKRRKIAAIIRGTWNGLRNKAIPYQ